MSIQRQVREFCRSETKLDGFDLPDPITMSVAIDSSMSSSEIQKHVRIHLGDGDTRGQTIIDHLDVLGRSPNCRVVLRVDRERFVAMLRAALVS